MTRIAYRALGLLACAVMFASLIAARPLQPQSSAVTPQSGHKQLQLPAYASAHVAQSAAAKTRAKLATQLRQMQLRAGLQSDVPMQARRTTPQVIRPAPIAGDGPLMRGQLVGQTERLDFYAGKNSFTPGEVADLAPRIEQALWKAELHFGTTLKRRVSVGFYRVPPKRGVRGMAYTADGRAELFYRAGEDTNRALTIAAHELGHHLEAQRYGEDVQRRADTILHEGMATWIAADRWLPMCEATTWRQRARQLQNAGIPLRLLTAEKSGADNAYELWASFVDFLAERYGWAKLDVLYASGRGRAPGSANYERVLGKHLDDLADEWRAWVAGS